MKQINSGGMRSEKSSASSGPGRVVVIEDQRLVAEYLARQCAELGLRVLQVCPGFESGLAAVRELVPSLVLLDISLPDGDGLELARLALKEFPRIKILAVSSHCDPWTMLQVQRLQLQGFVDKHGQRPEVLADAIRAVLGGQTYYTPIVNESSTTIRRDPKAFIRVLSDYETRILGLIGESQSDDEIAQVLDISPATVQSRRRDIMRKLAIHSTPKLIHYAIVNGLTRAEQLGRARPT